MTEQFDEGTEDRLRAVLRAQADSVDPSPEALTLIRERTERRPGVLTWFGMPWLRPALAVGAAAAIAGTVLIGTPQFRDQVFPASSDSGTRQEQEARDLAVSESTPPDTEDDDPEGGGVDGGPGPGSAESGGGTGGQDDSDSEMLPLHCRTPEEPGGPSAMATGEDEDGSTGETPAEDPECVPGPGSEDGGAGGGQTGGEGTGGDGGQEPGSGGDGDETPPSPDPGPGPGEDGGTTPPTDPPVE